MPRLFDSRYVLFNMLLIISHEDRIKTVNKLTNSLEDEYLEFAEWAKETIVIGENDLGEEFPDDFKSLFL